MSTFVSRQTPWCVAITVVSVAAAGAALFAGATISASLTQQPTSDAIGLPKPGGPLARGTVSFAPVDAARPEVLTESADDRRELLVRSWYPADRVPRGTPEPFWGKETAEIGHRLAEYLRMPRAFDGLASIESHAFANAPLRKPERRYPILIFSHGYPEVEFSRRGSRAALRKEQSSR